MKYNNKSFCKYTFLSICMLISLFCICLSSCGGDGDSQDNGNDGRNNTTDVAVTGSVSNIERESANISGYVNLNLITISYGECEYGVEIGSNMIKATSLIGRSFSITAKGLIPNHEYKYRTYVKVKDITYYGNYNVFRTKSITNYLEDLDATNISFSSVRLNIVVNNNKMANDSDKEKFRYGWTISSDKDFQKDIDFVYYNPNDTAVRSYVDNQNNLHLWHIIPKLSSETQYYYQAFIELNGNRFYTSTKTFTTQKLPFNIIDSGFVDLGLSCLWYATNLPGYFAWGETSTKSEREYTISNYKYSNPIDRFSRKFYYRHIGDDISGTTYDAARAKLGANSRMPTKAELEELQNNCKMYSITYNNQEGVVIVGKNGSAIFVPSEGYITSNEYSKYVSYEVETMPSGIMLWSSTLLDAEVDKDYRYAWALTVSTNYGETTISKSIDIWPRFWGLRIRPVSDK
ncbi:MAG: hypothetical protein J5905_06915 [Prevotella sp.]|nr:hypothetical protein [Prevotella sp.]